MQRPEPGTFLDDLPEALYHDKAHGFSSSDIKSIKVNGPEKFKYFYDQTDNKESDAMKIGSVLHCGLLRPDIFENEIAVLPELNLRTKAGREEKIEFSSYNKDRTVVSIKQRDLGMEMVASCQKNSEIMDLLQGAVAERSMYAEILGTPLRARPDAYKGHMLLELKSAKDATTIGFSKQIANLYYHVSLAHYAQVMSHANLPEEIVFENMEYKFIVVENTEPFCTAIRVPSERMIHIGFEQWKEGFALLNACRENNEWPGYAEEEIDLPTWAVPYDLEEE